MIEKIKKFWKRNYDSLCTMNIIVVVATVIIVSIWFLITGIIMALRLTGLIWLFYVWIASAFIHGGYLAYLDYKQWKRSDKSV